MSVPEKQNLAASVRQRLLSLSQKQKEPFDLILIRYGVERLLYRLSQSIYADRFLLKGAMLFHVWMDSAYRPTRDVDLLGFTSVEVENLNNIFQTISSLSVEPDGLIFLPKSVKTDSIRAKTTYGGVCVSMEARLENAIILIHCDVGFGDVVTPAPEWIEFPTLLDFPSPRLYSYPIYTVVSEKLEAMISLGEANSRMKDFYDLWFLSQQFDFDGETLIDAIHATFKRRKTMLPNTLPLVFTENFAVIKSLQWNNFLRRNKLPLVDTGVAIEDIRNFIEGPLLMSSQFRACYWESKKGWKKR